MSQFLDRLSFFRKVTEPFADGHGITTTDNVKCAVFANFC
jgi:hypothetical protein